MISLKVFSLNNGVVVSIYFSTESFWRVLNNLDGVVLLQLEKDYRTKKGNLKSEIINIAHYYISYKNWLRGNYEFSDPEVWYEYLRKKKGDEWHEINKKSYLRPEKKEVIE